MRRTPRASRGSIVSWCLLLSFLDVGLDQHGVLGTEQFLKRGECGERAFRVLLAVAAREADAADDLAIDHHGKAADERREAAFERELDAEGLVAGKRRPVGRRREQVRRALVAGRGEGLVPRNLRSRDARAIHALQRDGIAAVVDYANRLTHADLVRFAYRRLRHGKRFLQLELECAFHSPW